MLQSIYTHAGCDYGCLYTYSPRHCFNPHTHAGCDSSDGTTLGSYFSEDGKIWRMARLYKNDFPEKLLIGISSQSPKDNEHTCLFTEVSLTDKPVADFRKGNIAE